LNFGNSLKVKTSISRSYARRRNAEWTLCVLLKQPTRVNSATFPRSYAGCRNEEIFWKFTTHYDVKTTMVFPLPQVMREDECGPHKVIFGNQGVKIGSPSKLMY